MIKLGSKLLIATLVLNVVGCADLQKFERHKVSCYGKYGSNFTGFTRYKWIKIDAVSVSQNGTRFVHPEPDLDVSFEANWVSDRVFKEIQCEPLPK
ncbi:hypothetical protein AN666_14850 [Enterobacter hormaechei]|nr:hypothetical protein AN666_14850 [Enterobacter hormaechei]